MSPKTVGTASARPSTLNSDGSVIGGSENPATMDPISPSHRQTHPPVKPVCPVTNIFSGERFLERSQLVDDGQVTGSKKKLPRPIDTDMFRYVHRTLEDGPTMSLIIVRKNRQCN